LKTFNNMQNEKIITLSETNEIYIKYRDEIVKLKKDHYNLINENIQLKNELLSKEDKESKLIKQIDELDEINRIKIDELTIKSKQDIEMQKERTIFEVGKEILILREQQQFKIQELQENFNDRINKLINEKENVAEKFRNMIMQMDKNETKPILIENK